MTEFGRYRLSYEPPQSNSRFGYQIEPEVQMAISAEADLDQMCDFFESFLRASGYVLKGEVRIVEDTVSANDFVPFEFGGDSLIYGGSGTDTISFGGGQPVPYVGSLGQDVISFG
jgi:hypothetical protein